MSSVLKATIENKTTSVSTHFKKLTTGNNVLIVSVIVASYSFCIKCSMCPPSDALSKCVVTEVVIFGKVKAYKNCAIFGPPCI